MANTFWDTAKKALGQTILGPAARPVTSVLNTMFRKPTPPSPTSNLNYTPASTFLPKTNTQDVKSSTLSQPKYNPTANVVNENLMNNYTGQQTQTPTEPVLPQVTTPTPTLPTPTPVESEADKWFKMYQQSMAMTPQEEALQNQLSNLTTGADLGVAGLEGQGRGIPLSLVRGQQEKLLKQAAIQTQPLQKQLELLQAKRQAQMEGAKAGMDYFKEESQAFSPVKVGAGETLIDPRTGQTIYQGQPKEQSMSEKYGTGTIGEYSFYADQERQSGREPLSFDDYQTRDANRKTKAAVAGANNESYSLAQTVLQNPGLFNQLTATEKGKVAPVLAAMGFTAFGKPLSDTAIGLITEKEFALESLDDLSESLNNNKQYIGPVSGLQSLNPWSPAKKVLADIQRVRQIVGKALEGGVLRKEDEAKYAKILPTVNDTQDTVLYKMKQLKAQIAWDIDNYKNEQMLSGRQINNKAVDNMSDDEAWEVYNKTVNK